MRRSPPQPFAHRPRLLIHRRWPCSRWPVPARPASGCRGGQYRLCRIASSAGPVATKGSEFEHHLWPDKHAVLRTWNRSGTLGSMAELKGRNAPTPSNKKATPQGGFLISSACGDHDHAAWTGVLWSKECFTWHRPIFSGGYPPNIVGAASFHSRVRDGSEWFQCAMDTRIESLVLKAFRFFALR